MSTNETPPSPVASAMFDDLVKGTISLPLEGCKSMALGCATVSGIYGAITAFVNSGHQPQWTQWQTWVVLAPFALWAIAGLQFGVAYLPNVRLKSLLPDLVKGEQEESTVKRLLERETFLRRSIVVGSVLFWAAIVVAVVNVALVRVPSDT